jgi:transcriptional regulator with XRE-family HTH domain
MSTSKSHLRRDVEQIPSSEKRFYRKNDDVVARIHELKDEQGLTQKELAEAVGKTPSYVSRVLGGGVNLTLETIAEFEEALGAEILSVPTSSSVKPATKTRRYELGSRYTEAPTPAKSVSEKSENGGSGVGSASTVEGIFLRYKTFRHEKRHTSLHLEEAEGIG